MDVGPKRARSRTGQVNPATSTACSQSVAVFFSSARSTLLRTSVREILISTLPGFLTRSARLAQHPERAESVIRGGVTGGSLPRYGPKAIANPRRIASLRFADFGAGGFARPDQRACR
jgi:hypothetical protein